MLLQKVTAKEADEIQLQQKKPMKYQLETAAIG